jgi:glycosyltransferase involved in cell wall biosynthesis
MVRFCVKDLLDSQRFPDECREKGGNRYRSSCAPGGRAELGMCLSGEEWDLMSVRQVRPAAIAEAGALDGSVALFFAATGGGVQRGRVTIANALAERGVHVTCVMPQAKGPFLERLSPDVNVVDLGTRQPLQLVGALMRWLRAAQPAALIASQQHAIVAAVWARRLAGVSTPVIAIQHNTLSALCQHSRRRAVRWLLPSAARLFFRWADQVCAVSDGVARDLAAMTRIPVRDIRIVHNPTVTPELLAHAGEPCGHPWFVSGRAERPAVILGVGSLNPLKDFALLIRAFARLRRLRPARLVILGEGPERAKLEAVARELGVAADVDLPGFDPNPYRFMARADVFAVSSRVEGMPNAIIEALACGCPVVSTDCPSGPAEILQDGKHGRLVPIGDEAALAEAIAATLQAAPDPVDLRRRAADFSVERATERYLQLLGLQRPRSPGERSRPGAAGAALKARIAPVLGLLYSTIN